MRLTRLLAPLLALTVAGSLTACLGTDSTEPITLATVESATFAPSLGVDLTAAGWTHDASGLYFRTLTPASATAPTVSSGQAVSVRYTVWLTNGTQLESSTYSFTLGTGAVIPGWDLGIVGMKVGEKRRLLVPPALAYGPYAYGAVPANSVLVFDVELVSAP